MEPANLSMSDLPPNSGDNFQQLDEIQVFVRVFEILNERPWQPTKT